MALLPASQRRGLVPVVLLALVTALFETAGVISILPFMAVVMDPAAVQRYDLLRQALAFFELANPTHVVIAIGTATVVILATGNAVSAANLWVQTRYIARTRNALSSELFAGYLRQPYAFHVQRDAASLTKVVFSDVESALAGYLGSLLIALTRGLAALAILGVLLATDPSVALGTIVLLGGGYVLVYRLVRARQHRYGTEVNQANELRSRSALEGLGGIKELRVLGREATAASEFDDATRRLSSAAVAGTLVNGLPRPVIEVLAFGGIVGITMAFVLRGDTANAVPALALYAFVGYRLMPAFQQLYNTATTLKYHGPAVATLEADLAIVRAMPRTAGEAHGERPQDLPLKRAITVDQVTFTYPGAARPALAEVSLALGRNESVGLVGKTGSGKTTLVDLLLGLYPPDAGAICIDGVPLTEHNARAWRQRVGYVPQHVFLANASVAQNIALGLPADAIDHRKVEAAARMAQAEEFITLLPSGYDTVVGERGVRLSGGQRQRLGIARALYHEPDVLFFDEATSALDGQTEDVVMQAIRGLSRDRTVILIAHRLRTVQACDRIVMLDAGKVVANGTYEQLLATSLPFKRLAREGHEQPLAARA